MTSYASLTNKMNYDLINAIGLADMALFRARLHRALALPPLQGVLGGVEGRDLLAHPGTCSGLAPSPRKSLSQPESET